MPLTPAQSQKIKDEVHKYKASAAGQAKGNPVAIFCLWAPLAILVLEAIEALFPDTKPEIDPMIKGIQTLQKDIC
jgi:hypothetical protein